MNNPLMVDCNAPQPIPIHSDGSIRSCTFTPNNLSPDSLFSFNHTSPPSSPDSSQVSDKYFGSVSPELRGFITHTPLIIGDRVLVGTAKHRGTIAYIGPTHFAAGNWAGVVLDSEKGRHDGATHGLRYFTCPPKRGIFCRLDTLARDKVDSCSPNARIRISNKTPPPIYQATGPDQRRFSITTSNGLVRSNSARFDRRKIQSVIGTISPRTTASGPSTCSKLRRTYSDRSSWKRPEWVPPGSHDARSSGFVPEKQKTSKLSRSQTLPGLHEHSSRSPQRKRMESPWRKSYSLVRTDYPRTVSPQSHNKHHLSKSLTVLDKRTGRSLISSFSGNKPHQSDTRKRLWSTGSKRINNTSDINQSQQKYSDLLKAFATLTLCESQAQSLRKSFPSSEGEGESNLQVDCIMSCAQDRLMDLQSQLLEVYDARTKVAEELESTKKLYEQMRYVYESKKTTSQASHPKPGIFKDSRIEHIQSQLSEEFQRTKHLWVDIKKLHQRIQFPIKFNQPGSRSSTTAEATSVFLKRTLTPSTEEIEEDEAKLREINDFPDFKLRTPTPVLTDYQLKKLKMTSNHQNHYMALLGKIKVCRSVIHQNLDALFKEQDELDGLPNRTRLLHTVYEQQVARVLHTKSCNHRLATELSIIRAEIAHLSSRPVKEAHALVERFQVAQRTSVNAEGRINFLEQILQRLKEDIETWKTKVSIQDQRHTTLMRANLRVHQLTQFECKAHSLEQEQTHLVEKKQQELKNLMDELNFMSRVWANERQLKLNTNHQLKEKLTYLTEVHLVPKGTKREWSEETLCNGLDGDASITYELFGTLCKEIRRLQSRSANLVDALDTLSSKKCTPTQLESIQALVHRTKMSSSTKPSSPYFRREKVSNLSNSAPRLTVPSSMPTVIARPAVPSLPKTSSVADQKNTKPDLVCIDSRIRSATNSSPSVDNQQPFFQPNTRNTNLTRSMRQLIRPSQIFGTHLRRRPMSFYMRRSFEPELEGSIPEADEELENEESP